MGMPVAKADGWKKVIDRVSQIVQQISGNKLGEKQSYMVETRVKKRMLELSLPTPEDYLEYLESHFEAESGSLVSLLTTHHTFFFREFPHFEILKKMLPELVNDLKKRNEKCLKIWSAACSRGQEVYSLAMFLEYHLTHIDPSLTFKILGTDIDPESVSVASNGVYHSNDIKEIPLQYLGNHWAKGTGDISMYVKMKSALKSKCEFRVANLLDFAGTIGTEKFDVIFCRNVFIYFEQHQIEMICKNLFKHLQAKGVFFSGISESLTGMKLDIVPIGPSVYLQKDAAESHPSALPTTKTASVGAPMRSPEVFAPELLRVMCVDDSPSIITLLKRILSKEHGFEVVTTAVNGMDAIEKMKQHKIDVVTLDIHMPEMDGISYLQKNYKKGHPPVVMISSVSRSDSDLAMKALNSGASDYVEKPALTNMEERGEEIRTKLRSVARDLYEDKSMISSVDKELQRHYVIPSPESKMRVVFGHLSDVPKMKKFFHEVDLKQPPSFVLFQGQGEILEAFVKEHEKDFKQKVKVVDSFDFVPEANVIYFADMKKVYPKLIEKYEKAPTSIVVYGAMTAKGAEEILKWKGAHLLLEDLGAKEMKRHPLAEVAADVVPATSFAYMSTHFLGTR